jgi:glycosyltransferase involved in cell wall biosynthesis
MNILFVLYGDFRSNSANPLVLYARELRLSGHACAVAVPSHLETISLHEQVTFRPVLYDDVLNAPEAVFPDGRSADVIHACTPREVVRLFVTSYMAKRPTPLVIYLEDNEGWIATRALGLNQETLYQHTEREISEKLPDALSHPFRYESFIGLADAVAVIQDKLALVVPPWVHCETVMIGVDVELFSPRASAHAVRAKYAVAENERIIVYHGGMNQFTRPGIKSLCEAVGLIRKKGYPCRLLRAGRTALDFLGQLPRETANGISDLGLLPRNELPNLLALADVFVQPGELDPFEDLRLPGKIPEFLAMGRPVVMPDTNIAHLFRDGLDAVLLRTGNADEIATKCIELFSDPERADEIGRAGRCCAEKYFDVRCQAKRLEQVYETARKDFSSQIASQTWRGAEESTPVKLLLARRLRLLADVYDTRDGLETGALLREYARCIETMEQRMRGVDATLAERDREIATLKEAIEGFIESKSWKLTSPLRKVGSVLRRLSKVSTRYSEN